MNRYDVIVPAGGAARRLDGVDKPALLVAGVSLLDRVIEAAAGAERVVVAGPRRPTRRPVAWVCEDPPGGGPVAALAAALPTVQAPVVVLLAADLPFVTGELVERLAARVAAGPVDAVLAVDGDGREQYLLAAFRTAALRTAVAALGDPGGASLRRVVGALTVSRLPADPETVFDCDTWADVRSARSRSGRMGTAPKRRDMTGLEEWTEAVKQELGIELDVDIAALLDMTRVAAHNVQRPAAPLTSFLVGYAAAARGGGEAAVAEALRQARELAERRGAAAGDEPGA
ncbi:NTP transferase domain-containing protein [Streptomyces sp. SID3343]|uniref:NTP transferase domain-containing protein n=1 Tax=Streptomyces sp. SID3343 TaxID=2690260 RepID=UPI001370A9E0|nr:NTP transferase domain-containing protein [Streptomyces sp. SID3343]